MKHSLAILLLILLLPSCKTKKLSKSEERLEYNSKELLKEEESLLSQNESSKVCANPLTAVNFNHAVEFLEKEGKELKRLDLAKNLCESSCLKCYQIAKICTLLEQEVNRLDLAKHAYSFSYDPENYTWVFRELSFQSSREELERYISEL